MSERREPPPTLVSLKARINDAAGAREGPLRRIERAVANTVVGQMIPSGVIKGGTGTKFRVGEGMSRFTPDFDPSRPAPMDVESYVDELQGALAQGWGGFGATIEAMDGPHRLGKWRLTWSF